MTPSVFGIGNSSFTNGIAEVYENSLFCLFIAGKLDYAVQWLAIQQNTAGIISISTAD